MAAAHRRGAPASCAVPPALPRRRSAAAGGRDARTAPLLLLLTAAFAAAVATAQQPPAPAYCAVQLRPSNPQASLRISEFELYDDNGNLMGATDRALLLDGAPLSGDLPGAQCGDGDPATDCGAAPAAAGAPPVLAALFRCSLGLRRVVVTNTRDGAAREWAAALVLTAFRPGAAPLVVALGSVKDEYVIPLGE